MADRSETISAPGTVNRPDPPDPVQDRGRVSGARQYRVTKHAVVRYLERVKPGLDSVMAKAEIERLLEISDPPSSTPPVWDPDLTREGRLSVEPCEGIAFVIAGRCVVTVATRGGMDEASRENRRAAKRKRRRARRARASKDAGYKEGAFSPDGLKKPKKKEWDRE